MYVFFFFSRTNWNERRKFREKNPLNRGWHIDMSTIELEAWLKKGWNKEARLNYRARNARGRPRGTMDLARLLTVVRYSRVRLAHTSSDNYGGDSKIRTDGLNWFCGTMSSARRDDRKPSEIDDFIAQARLAREDRLVCVSTCLVSGIEHDGIAIDRAHARVFFLRACNRRKMVC